ncbi:MAG TPA: M28 family peptidase [Blastocatellia bacterium]
MKRLQKISSGAVRFSLVMMLVVGCYAQTSSLRYIGPSGAKGGGRDSITTDELKDWLGYISSDELEGRNTFSEGLGLAAAYIADHLKEWGIKPGGDSGSYFQRVKVLGVKSTNHSTITVEANGQTRTFENGSGVTFPANVGSKRTFSADEIEFMGYGLDAPLAGHNDYANANVKGKVVVWLGAAGPKGLDQSYRRALFGRARFATEQQGAVASIGPVLTRGRGQGAGGGAAAAGRSGPNDRGQGAAGRPPQQPVPPGFPQIVPVEPADFTTVQRLDTPLAPAVSAQDDFFEFLFAGQEARYADLKEKADKQEPLPLFKLKNVKITINTNADYRIVRTQYTRNVIGILDGSDPALKNTYVAIGAHYDHVGYAEGEIVETEEGRRRAGAPGRVTESAIGDRIWNGADDDGSGTVTELAIAKAFALGPRPKRSLLFVWHAGEEKGLLGSRYFADYPTIPMDHIVAQLNMDMVGRNNNDKAEEGNTVYLVGSDRISTELHNIAVDADQSLSKPLALDYAMNDPTDLEQVYYRSDHYSYAAKGIPIIFFTTGLHVDYHANTDSAEKILYPKMATIGQLVYEIGLRVANLDHPPIRDNKGPRAGKGSSGKLPM